MPTPNGLLRQVRRFVETARPDAETDRALVERFARSRDERAFAELVTRHGPMILGVCRRVLRHAADAEDAFQATFLILVRKARTIRDPDRVGPWLFGVAWRIANKLRAARRPGSTLPDDFPAADHAQTSEWPVELDDAIARLPEKYRAPVILCHLQGLTPTEVADRLGCPPATVATRLFRARAKLRRRLVAAGLVVPPVLVTGTALHVPSALASSVREIAAGRSVPLAAARLADGVFRSLIVTKIRWAATAAVVCLAGAGVLGFKAGGQDLPPRAAPPTVTPPPVAPPVIPPAEFVPPPVAAAPERREDASDTKITTNFKITGPSPRIVHLFGEAAERARKEQAVAWLGKELPRWDPPWPMKITLSQGAGGSSTFDFDSKATKGRIEVQGELDRLLADVVPHEITHCVLADFFGVPIPRWADEGMAILSESDEERNRHQALAKEAVGKGDLIQTKALFQAKEYPTRSISIFFAQGYWVTKVLVDRKDRPTLVAFLKDGMKDGWEPAAKTHYGYASLAELEADYTKKLGAAPVKAAAATPRAAPQFATASADADGRITINLPGALYQPVTAYLKREGTIVKDGKKESREYYEPVTCNRHFDKVTPTTFPAIELSATTADGKAVTSKALVAALKDRPVAVVLTTDRAGIDKTFAAILKPDTLILILPARKNDAELFQFYQGLFR